MEFTNKGFSNVVRIAFYIFLVFFVIFIFAQILPYIFILGIGGWGIHKIVNAIKKRRNAKDDSFSTFERVERMDEEYFDLSNKTIIETEYEEIK